MSRQHIPLKVTAARFARAVRTFMTSEVGGKARFMFAGLVILFCGISGLNVVNNYVGRNFMTAIADRQNSEFVRQATFYIGAFAASTVVSVIAQFTEERLALLWREFLTRRIVGLYVSGGTSYRLDVSGQLSNPDQRIAEDVRTFTTTTLSFVLMMLNSSLTILAFSGVLWSISPLLFIVAVLYAACGSYATIVLGRPLINLNYDQLDKEATFRSSLIRVRENAESIVLSRGEELQAASLLRRLGDLIANFRRITAINRNVGFFTTGYNWMIQIIPVLIIAPAFMRGDLEFGVITQSAAAFAMLVGAFSFIITQFKSISNFAAVVARLSSMVDAIETAQAPRKAHFEMIQNEGSLSYERLTLTSPDTTTPLLKDLSLTIPVGARVLVTGTSEAAGVAMFRATAGIADEGRGRIMRPGPDQIQFLPQRPYLPPGTLRQILVPPERSSEISDERFLRLLTDLNLERAINLAGDLDNEQDWSILLTPREQHLLAIASALLASRRFVLIEKGSTILGSEQLHKVLHRLAEGSITCVNFGETDEPHSHYDAVLEYDGQGAWTWTDNRV